MVNIPYTEVFELEFFGEKLGPLPKMQSFRGAQVGLGVHPDILEATEAELFGHLFFLQRAGWHPCIFWEEDRMFASAFSGWKRKT